MAGMQATIELDVGKERLAAIIAAFPPESVHWNEAENRFQFIDRLMMECLGWSHPAVHVEVKNGTGGKADYILGMPPRAVLEAKREAKHFGNLPSGKPTVVRKLAPLLAASKVLEDAVHQALGYCALKGAQLAIVCNGPQLLIFPALVPGESPLEGECYFFNGYPTYLAHFILLWTLLSPEGIHENRAYRDISQHRNPRIPEKAAIAIPEPFRHRYRSDFQEDIRSIASLLLEDIEDNPDLKEDFYRDCYVPIAANNRHLLLSKKIIQSRYKRVSGDGVSPTGLDEVAKVGGARRLKLKTADIVAGTTARPIVVIGDVGVGKTSFFEKLRFDLGGSDDTLFLHINLGLKANLANDLKSYVTKEIPRIFFESYGLDICDAEFVNAIYHADLMRFDKSIEGSTKHSDPSEYDRERRLFLRSKLADGGNHLLAAIGHLARGRNKQIILIMDNADQRDYAIQQEAFLIAQELSATRNLIVFIALRPSTFLESKARGALSGYQNKLFAISPPPADEVVQKRLTFAIRIAEGKEKPPSLEGIRIQLDNIAAFLRATLRSIKYNTSIQQFLSNISGGNTRSVIELITTFFGSPNVDSEKIVTIEIDTGSYNVPLHEFTKHALLGEYSYYNANSSVYALNVFDVRAADPREHFLAPLIVAYLSSNLGMRDSDGFVKGGQIVEEMTKSGFVDSQTRAAIKLLASKRLIETPHAHYREVAVPDVTLPDDLHFRSTTIGIYHVRFWIGTFSFLDAVSIDTPIFDASVRGYVFERASSFDIRDRLNKALSFREYLEAQWHLANLTPNYYDFPAVLQSQRESFEIVRAVVENSPKKRPKRAPRQRGFGFRS